MSTRPSSDFVSGSCADGAARGPRARGAYQGHSRSRLGPNLPPLRKPASSVHRSRCHGIGRGSSVLTTVWDHPAAAVELAWDRDHDIVYVVWAHRALRR